LSKHAFKVIKAAPEAPAPAEQVASKRKESTGKKKIAVKKKSCGGSKKKSTGNERKTSTKKAPVIRSSFQRSKQILDAIEKHGMEDWELVASEVPDWSAEDCRRRWALYLDPTLSREPFTKKEIRQILSFQSKHGNDWMVLAPKLERRSCSYISDRWNRKFRKLAVGQLLKLGLTEEQIEGDEKKRINYHGHFEAVLKVVVAAKP
jgi:Myb-like DNA-binding domain